ncbi:hypothetical protein OH76DRAFT_1404734 [Lentinus brumalis]|uniref:Uncharacterized protein n=1 Tax=Lentinus brumalis TaxID=2498619 RepID=A0A371D7H0_9APHY|nr:hypothetical protein OH76DRAFT_1404734 [Polyporus brumalis]
MPRLTPSPPYHTMSVTAALDPAQGTPGQSFSRNARCPCRRSRLYRPNNVLLNPRRRWWAVHPRPSSLCSCLNFKPWAEIRDCKGWSNLAADDMSSFGASLPARHAVLWSQRLARPPALCGSRSRATDPRSSGNAVPWLYTLLVVPADRPRRDNIIFGILRFILIRVSGIPILNMTTLQPVPRIAGRTSTARSQKFKSQVMDPSRP